MAPGHTACGVAWPRCLQQPHTAPAFRQVNWVLPVAPSLGRHGQGSAPGPQPLPAPLPEARCQPISLSLSSTLPPGWGTWLRAQLGWGQPCSRPACLPRLTSPVSLPVLGLISLREEAPLPPWRSDHSLGGACQASLRGHCLQEALLSSPPGGGAWSSPCPARGPLPAPRSPHPRTVPRLGSGLSEPLQILSL